MENLKNTLNQTFEDDYVQIFFTFTKNTKEINEQ